MQIHFQPTGKLLRERESPVLTDAGEEEMPIYILRGSPEEEKWLQENPSKRRVKVSVVHSSHISNYSFVYFIKIMR